MCNLAIVIPYYNIGFFQKSLESLASQTNMDFKVYIGNDASLDNPEYIIEEFKTKFNLKYQRFDENLGGKSLVKQWDRCIALTENEKWVMILGDDDYLEANVVEAFYANLNIFEEKSNVVRFASQMVFNNKNNNISEVYKHPVWENSKDSFYRKHKCLTRSSLSEHVFSKKQYLKHQFFNYPLAWFSDDRAWLEFSESKPIYAINDAKVFVRLSSESISGKQDNLEQKRMASSMFYNYIVNQKLRDFNKNERLEIVKSYLERTLAVRDIKVKEWLFFVLFHFKNFTIPTFKKFSKIFIKSIFKLNKNRH